MNNMDKIKMPMGLRCPVCGGESPAHFDDCQSIERNAQRVREENMSKPPIEQEEKPEPQEMAVLFVGGPKDGQRIGMSDLPTVYQATYPNPDYSILQDRRYEPEPQYLIAPYRREAFRCKAGLYPVYVFHSSPQEDVVHLLLEGYKSPSVAVN